MASVRLLGRPIFAILSASACARGAGSVAGVLLRSPLIGSADANIRQALVALALGGSLPLDSAAAAMLADGASLNALSARTLAEMLSLLRSGQDDHLPGLSRALVSAAQLAKGTRLEEAFDAANVEVALSSPPSPPMVVSGFRLPAALSAGLAAATATTADASVAAALWANILVSGGVHASQAWYECISRGWEGSSHDDATVAARVATAALQGMSAALAAATSPSSWPVAAGGTLAVLAAMSASKWPWSSASATAGANSLLIATATLLTVVDQANEHRSRSASADKSLVALVLPLTVPLLFPGQQGVNNSIDTDWVSKQAQAALSTAVMGVVRANAEAFKAYLASGAAPEERTAIETALRSAAAGARRPRSTPAPTPSAAPGAKGLLSAPATGGGLKLNLGAFKAAAATVAPAPKPAFAGKDLAAFLAEDDQFSRLGARARRGSEDEDDDEEEDGDQPKIAKRRESEEEDVAEQ
jgi:hypothetical protein